MWCKRVFGCPRLGPNSFQKQKSASFKTFTSNNLKFYLNFIVIENLRFPIYTRFTKREQPEIGNYAGSLLILCEVFNLLLKIVRLKLLSCKLFGNVFDMDGHEKAKAVVQLQIPTDSSCIIALPIRFHANIPI